MTVILGNFVDGHKWEDDVQECPVGEKHREALRCAVCGARRTVAAEHGCYHYYIYEHPEHRSWYEVPPPCAVDAVLPSGAAIGTTRLCGGCGHLMGGPLAPSHGGRCNEKGVIVLRCLVKT